MGARIGKSRSTTTSAGSRTLHDLRLFPSEYLERQVHFVYVTDTYGVQNRQRIGVERMLWSTDYPHASSSWPNTWSAVQASMSGVPSEERQAHPVRQRHAALRLRTLETIRCSACPFAP